MGRVLRETLQGEEIDSEVNKKDAYCPILHCFQLFYIQGVLSVSRMKDLEGTCFGLEKGDLALVGKDKGKDLYRYI